jgi:hypothetical protein
LIAGTGLISEWAELFGGRTVSGILKLYKVTGIGAMLEISIS